MNVPHVCESTNYLCFLFQLFDEKARGEKQIQQLTQENKRLLAAIETLKDHLAEAEDRLGNMKLQATVKEVNISSMGIGITC